MNTRFGFVGTYPPTICGLATFTASLFAELVTVGGDSGRVIRSVEKPQPREQPLQQAGQPPLLLTRSQTSAGTAAADELVAGDAGSVRRCAITLNQGDIAIVQHEYGIYGGVDGEEILQLLAALNVPTVVVLHTVLTAPTAHQKLVMEEVAGLADAVVVMTDTARGRLAGYLVDLAKVTVIPHGAPAIRNSITPASRSGQPTVLTWGLIGPGKGIEWGIEAMAALRDLRPAPRYIVAGQTHPKVLLREGETYRNGLLKLVRELDLSGMVTFDSHYRHTAALVELVDSADVVLLAYDSTDQVTSGVLIEAVAAGKPVIATRFPHAVELLGAGAGMLVPHRDPAAIAAALRTVLTHRDVAAGMTRTAATTTPELLWPAVAARYRQLAGQLIRDRVAA